MNRVDERFPSMGSEARVRLESPTLAGSELRALAAGARATIESVERSLTRFDLGSDLSRFNADPRERVDVPLLVSELVRAARWAAETSGGLVDATLLSELELAGYAASRTGAQPAPLDHALAAAPPRRPARASGRSGALDLVVEDSAHVRRPPGLRLDSGGLGKGIAADLAARGIPVGVRYAISCGGDLAVGPSDWSISVTSAFTDEQVHRLAVRRGGVATSGIQRRLWRGDDGEYVHHLLDPSTGRPAWTGLVAATAVGRSALEAEVLAKSALLSGPDGASQLLSRWGGVLQHDDARVEVIQSAQVIRLPRRTVRPLRVSGRDATILPLRPGPGTAA